MIGVGMAVVWFAIVSMGLIACAAIERRHRLARLIDRPEWAPPRADWGFDARPPAAHYVWARMLAGGARMVRTTNFVADRSGMLALFGRVVSCIAVASALAIIPFAGTWGGAVGGLVLVPVDVRYGLFALVFLLFLMGMAQVTVGLADRNVWSRLGAVRIATRNLGGLGLVMIVLAPLALETSSLRLQDIVFAQQQTFAPLSWLPAPVGVEVFEIARAWRWPNWNLFSQPLTALLFLPSLGCLLHRPWILDSTTGNMGTSGFGVDADPVDLYWGRLDVRLSRVLAASLFVSLFLGAGAIPYVSPSAVVDFLTPLIGFKLPALLGVIIQIGAYIMKLMIVLVLISFMRRSMAVVREEQWISIVVLRLFPLAWANLLLMSAVSLLSDSIRGAN